MGEDLAGEATSGRHLSVRLLVALLFATLLIGAVGALLITRDLRRGADVVSSVKVTHRVSPTQADRDDVRIRFRLSADEERVSVEITGADGAVVRTLLADEPLAAGRHDRDWDGVTDGGTLAPPGSYMLRILLPEKGREVVPTDVIRLQRPPEA